MPFWPLYKSFRSRVPSSLMLLSLVLLNVKLQVFKGLMLFEVQEQPKVCQCWSHFSSLSGRVKSDGVRTDKERERWEREKLCKMKLKLLLQQGREWWKTFPQQVHGEWQVFIFTARRNTGRYHFFKFFPLFWTTAALPGKRLAAAQTNMTQSDSLRGFTSATLVTTSPSHV